MLRTINQFPAMPVEELPLFKASLELQFGVNALAVHARERKGGEGITADEAASLMATAHAYHMVTEFLDLRAKHNALLRDYANLQSTLSLLGEINSDQENA